MTSTRRGRIEDRRLLTGEGRYTDDLPGHGALWAAFVRSPHAAARFEAPETTGAAAMPGVQAVFTAADLEAAGIGPVQAPLSLTGPDGREWQATPRSLLAAGQVRFVGEPVAMVIADSLEAARDAAEAVAVDWQPLPAAATLAAAQADGAPLVHEDRPGNLAFQVGRGDWEAAGAALESSARRVRLDSRVSRVAPVAMEPRTALAAPGDDGRTTLHVSHQNPVALRAALAGAFALDKDAIRVVAGDVGGAFGMKSGPVREEMLTFWAAHRLGCHVRWRADRSESFLTDEAGRDLQFEAELGLDEAGHFTALRVRLLLDTGAYASGRSAPPVINFGGIAGVYRTPVIAGRIDAFLTHTVPVAPYRGAGRPEATFVIEQLIDKAAHEAGIDKVELRRRNLITPDQMPWQSPFIFDYDSGDFPRVLDAGLARADAAGIEARRAQSEARGLLRGFGLALCIETAGGIYGNPGRDHVELTMQADGRITLDVGAFSAGAGLETAFTDLAAEMLSQPAEAIAYRQGDTDALAQGKGMGGSAAMVQGGAALRVAADRLMARAQDIAADELEAALADIEFTAGRFRIKGTDREIALTEVARIAAERSSPLAAAGEFTPENSTFPNGCHICEVEIDPQTGRCTIAAYAAVEDIGNVLNAQLAEGQIHGGVVQALGQVLMEDMVYDAEGQLLSASFMDYAMPRAADLPFMACGFEPVPTARNPLGVKGVGEAGSVGALAAGMSAVNDALRRAGAPAIEMPATPARVWQALRQAGQGG